MKLFMSIYIYFRSCVDLQSPSKEKLFVVCPHSEQASPVLGCLLTNHKAHEIVFQKIHWVEGQSDYFVLCYVLSLYHFLAHKCHKCHMHQYLLYIGALYIFTLIKNPIKRCEISKEDVRVILCKFSLKQQRFLCWTILLSSLQHNITSQRTNLFLYLRTNKKSISVKLPFLSYCQSC